MAGQAYVGTTKRSFYAAIFHMLENEYSILGSRRILEMLANDLQNLVDEFFPPTERIAPGWMVFVGTKATGGKARVGKTAEDHELVSIAWPVLLPEDYPSLLNGVFENKKHPERKSWFQHRLIRILEYGYNHPAGPVLLTLSDLSCMLGLETVEISQILKDARENTKKNLPTKGYYFDQGMRPTHKMEIISLYEAGLDEKEIAQRTNHALNSVGNYIRGYERVRLMIDKKIPLLQISILTDLQPNVVLAYIALLKEFHPDLFLEIDT